MSLASDPPREESRCDGGSDGSARGGDTSNGASQQHCRRPTHHSAPRSGWPEQHNAHGNRRPPGRWRRRRRSARCTTPLRGLKRPPPGERPAPLSEVAGPHAAVTVGYVAAGVPLLGAPSMASPSAEAIDESTLSFLRAENLARVKEKVEVEELVADLAWREQKLLEELERHRASFKRGDRGSRVEAAGCLVVYGQDCLGREGDHRQPRAVYKYWAGGSSSSCSSCPS